MNADEPQSNETQVAENEEEITITRRSDWSGIFWFLGFVGLVVAAVGAFLIFIAGENSKLPGIFVLATGVIGSIQSFFISFLINVLTDIRWFLSEMTEKRNKENLS